MKAFKNIHRKLALLAVVFSVGLVVTGCETTGIGGKSIQELTTAANSGDPAASLKLGDYFYKQKKFTESEKWYKKASEQYKTK
jgi:TPR repeat protein